MNSEAQLEQIIQKLKTIDQFHFEMMAYDLLHQGAFPEIMNEGALIKPYGINSEKMRTIRSAPRADAEDSSQGLIIESSVQENWIAKFSEVLKKNKGKNIKTFVFFTNQDTRTKQIKIKGKSLDAEKFCTKELGCERSSIVGRRELVLPMQNPKFFSIRRNYLGITYDFFCSARDYNEIIKNSSLKCESDEPTLQRYSVMLRDKMYFDHSRIVILHNNDYTTLLHTVGAWSLRLVEENHQEVDFCFIKWPSKNANVISVDRNEVDKKIPTFLVVWGADQIDNITEYLYFNQENVSIIIVTPTSFKDVVRNKLEMFKGTIRVEEVFVEAIDERVIGPEEKAKHREKVKAIVNELSELILQFEALVYFFTPFSLADEQKNKRVIEILDIDESKLDQLKGLLVEGDLAAITGSIFWLKQPNIAKELLSEFITRDIIHVESLVA